MIRQVLSGNKKFVFRQELTEREIVLTNIDSLPEEQPYLHQFKISGSDHFGAWEAHA